MPNASSCNGFSFSHVFVLCLLNLQIMAGLLDQYLYAKNEQALKMIIGMAQYFENRVRNVISKDTIERHWESLNEETGGMNDVLYDLYTITVKT